MCVETVVIGLPVEIAAHIAGVLLGDVQQGLIKSAKHHLCLHRLAIKVFGGHLHGCRLAGLIGWLIRLHSDIEHALSRGDTKLRHLLMHVCHADGGCFDEEVGTVFVFNGDINDRGFTIHVNQLPIFEDTVLRIGTQQHIAISLLGVDHDMRGLSGLVGAFVGDEFQFVESVKLAIKLIADHSYEAEAFDGAAPAIR